MIINLIASLINVANFVRSSRSESFGRSQDWAAHEPLNVLDDFDQELDLSSLRPDLQYFDDVRYMTSNRIFVGPTLKNVWEEDSCYTSWHKSEFNQKQCDKDVSLLIGEAQMSHPAIRIHLSRINKTLDLTEKKDQGDVTCPIPFLTSYYFFLPKSVQWSIPMLLSGSPYNLQSTVYSSSQSYMSCPHVLRWTVRYHRQMRTSMLDILDRQTCRVPRNTPRRIIIATVRLLDSPLLGRKPFTITNTLVTRSPACDSQATNAEIGAEGLVRYAAAVDHMHFQK